MCQHCISFKNIIIVNTCVHFPEQNPSELFNGHDFGGFLKASFCFINHLTIR